MIQNDDSAFIKSMYSLMDFATFKLCPALYAYSVSVPQEGNVTSFQKRLKKESDILNAAFESFVKSNVEQKRVFFNSTRKCLILLIDEISKECESRYSSGQISGIDELREILSGLYEKAENITADIHRVSKGSRYTIVNGVEKVYDFKDFKFIYRSSFRVFDPDVRKYKTLYVNEYEYFPVFSAGTINKELIHYGDILRVLNENPAHTDRVGLAIKIVKKINGQLESPLYINDGFERIEKLAEDIRKYDFSRPKKMKSDFCKFCKFSHKCF